VLEEAVGGATERRYVWSPVYVDALVLRDRDTDANGSLDERLYVIQDANFNVVALLDTSGNVVERYTYSPFGVQTVYDASYTVRGGGSAYSFTHGFQGMAHDSVAGLNPQRWRWYSPTLGRWVTMDPIRYDAGDVNLYRAMGNSPVHQNDPAGLDVRIDDIQITDTGKSIAHPDNLPAGTKPPAKAGDYGTLGPATAPAGRLECGFQVTINATVNNGSKITDAMIKQEVFDVTKMTRNDGTVVWRAANSTTAAKVTDKGGGKNQIVTEAAGKANVELFEKAAPNMGDVWKNVTLDGNARTGAGGRFRAGFRGLLTDASSANKLIWVDFPGWPNLDPAKYKEIVEWQAFKITAEGTNQKNVVTAQFLLKKTWTSDGKTWTLKEYSPNPKLPNTWK
jgi:RHS repeat-associated protein